MGGSKYLAGGGTALYLGVGACAAASVREPKFLGVNLENEDPWFLG